MHCVAKGPYFKECVFKGSLFRSLQVLIRLHKTLHWISNTLYAICATTKAIPGKIAIIQGCQTYTMPILHTMPFMQSTQCQFCRQCHFCNIDNANFAHNANFAFRQCQFCTQCHFCIQTMPILHTMPILQQIWHWMTAKLALDGCKIGID